ncbi:MAG TPA: biopolymer transporter ExbD [Candidatus Angelobacter sp.]|nr:biopolymer transporter ExbD [Candidatus Angelobacter sp.]
MSTRANSQAAKINSRINVAPMVDVMLVLLIIFMVITPMIQAGRVKLATTSNPMPMPDVNREDALVVAVMHDGTIFLGSQIVTGETLTEKIKDESSTHTDKTVYVRADARVRYGALVNVVDDLRSAGIDQLGLLTQQRQRRLMAAPQP